jgi:hypothetical protein
MFCSGMLRKSAAPEDLNGDGKDLHRTVVLAIHVRQRTACILS